MESIKITVTGRVQRVGFRWSVASLAQRLNIKGFVKNLPNGDVYIEADGPTSLIAEFTKWVQNGPTPLASVEYVDVVNQPLQSFIDFQIR